MQIFRSAIGTGFLGARKDRDPSKICDIGSKIIERRKQSHAEGRLKCDAPLRCFRTERVTTDGHGFYPRAIGAVLGKTVRHRTGAHLKIVLSSTIAESRVRPGVCEASKAMMRRSAPAENTRNSEISVARASVTIAALPHFFAGPLRQGYVHRPQHHAESVK
jgi:hypothetical protein